MRIFRRSMFCEPLTSSPENQERIQKFVIERESNVSAKEDRVIGLESYLKRVAWFDDLTKENRFYVVRPYFSDDIIAYFGVRAGMVCSSEDRDENKDNQAKEQGSVFIFFPRL